MISVQGESNPKRQFFQISHALIYYSDLLPRQPIKPGPCRSAAPGRFFREACQLRGAVYVRKASAPPGRPCERGGRHRLHSHLQSENSLEKNATEYVFVARAVASTFSPSAIYKNLKTAAIPSEIMPITKRLMHQ